MKIMLWVGISVLCGGIYHLAGIGGFPGAKLLRRVICPLLALGLFSALKPPLKGAVLAYPAFLVLNYGALSTYCSTLVKPDDEVSGVEWFCTGALYGLAALPLLWCGVPLWAILGRAVFLAVTIMWMRVRTGKVFKEEFFSGFLYCGSMIFLV